jgi:hypothetical protein
MLKLVFGVGELYVNRRYDNHKENLNRYVVRKRPDFLKFQDCLKRVERNDHLNAIGMAGRLIHRSTDAIMRAE